MPIINSIKNRRVLQIIIVSISLLIVLGGVYALNTWNEGYRVNNGASQNVIVGSASGACHKVINNNGNDIFVPTKTTSEWNSFDSYKPSGVSTGGCATWQYTGYCYSGWSSGACTSWCDDWEGVACPGQLGVADMCGVTGDANWCWYCELECMY